MNRFITLVFVLIGTISSNTHASDIIHVKLIAEPTPAAYEIGAYFPVFSTPTNTHGDRLPFLSWKLRVNCKENTTPAVGDKCSIKNTTTRWMTLIHKTSTGITPFNLGPNETLDIGSGEKVFF